MSKIYDEDIIDLDSSPLGSPSTAPRSFTPASTKTSQLGAVNAKASSKLPKSTLLAGKTFVIMGNFVTMTLENAMELCEANGGRVTNRTACNITHFVVGAKGTRQNLKELKDKGATKLTESEFLSMILSQAESTSSGKKRDNTPPEAPEGSRPKKARKLEEGAESNLPILQWATDFAKYGELQIKGKTLTAYYCGGEVFKAQRGKSLIDLLQKFDKYMKDCDGDPHRFMY